MLGGESLPALARGTANRGNAYLAPRAKFDPGTLVLPSFDCNRAGEKPPTNTPGCKVQGPVPFEGKSQRYPNVEPAQAGGRLRSGGG